MDLLVLGHVPLSSQDVLLSSTVIYYGVRAGGSFSFTCSINHRECRTAFNTLTRTHIQ